MPLRIVITATCFTAAFASTTLFAQGSNAATGVNLEPVISGATYCQTSDGHVTLRLRFVLHYHNTSESTIVVPMFSVPSGYELFAGEAAFNPNRKERSVSLHRDDVLDATKLDPANQM